LVFWFLFCCCCCFFFFFFFFCNHCLNDKIIMVKNKSRVYYSLRTLCYITMERLIKQNVVVSGCVCVQMFRRPPCACRMLSPLELFPGSLVWLWLRNCTSSTVLTAWHMWLCPRHSPAGCLEAECQKLPEPILERPSASRTGKRVGPH
jgi:hypothetical protein